MSYPGATIAAVALLLTLHAPTPAPAAAGAGVTEYRECSAAERDALLAKVKERLGAVRTIKAGFAQERRLSLFVDIVKSGGAIYFEAPGKLRWEITEPYRSLLIFNEGKLAKFTVVAGELQKMNLGMEEVLLEVLRQIISFMRGDFEKVRGKYALTVRKGPDYLVHLQPAAGMAKAITAIELHLDPESSHVTRIRIHEPQDDFMEIRFFAEEQDTVLPAGLFDLDKQTVTTGPSAPKR